MLLLRLSSCIVYFIGVYGVYFQGHFIADTEKTGSLAGNYNQAIIHKAFVLPELFCVVGAVFIFYTVRERIRTPFHLAILSLLLAFPIYIAGYLASQIAHKNSLNEIRLMEEEWKKDKPQ